MVQNSADVAPLRIPIYNSFAGLDIDFCNPDNNIIDQDEILIPYCHVTKGNIDSASNTSSETSY